MLKSGYTRVVGLLIQYDWCSYKKGTMWIQRKNLPCEKACGIIQVKEAQDCQPTARN